MVLRRENTHHTSMDHRSIHLFYLLLQAQRSGGVEPITGAEGFSTAIVLLQHIGAVVAQSKKVTIKAPPGEHSVKTAAM
ncbi:unnamed protein product [Boreogadus saida]